MDYLIDERGLNDLWNRISIFEDSAIKRNVAKSGDAFKSKEEFMKYFNIRKKECG